MTTSRRGLVGDDWLVWLRDALLRNAKRASGLPNKEDVKQGLITYKIAAPPLTWRKGIRARKFAITPCRSPLRISLGRPV